MKPRTKTLLGLLLGYIVATFYFKLQELNYNVFGDTVHFKKALVKLWLPILFTIIWLLIFYMASRSRDEE
jgi:hypothetical protein